PVPTPEGLLDEIAAMTSAINDAPTGTLEIEDEVFTGERVRAYEQAQVAGGRRLYRVVARHRGSGELAGQTVAAVDVERPWFAYQHDTSVVRAHRGHRLGLLLKIEMLRWLREEEPQVRRMDTDNAADNAYMIAINEMLGSRVVGPYVERHRRLCAPCPREPGPCSTVDTLTDDTCTGGSIRSRGGPGAPVAALAGGTSVVR